MNYSNASTDVRDLYKKRLAPVYASYTGPLTPETCAELDANCRADDIIPGAPAPGDVGMEVNMLKIHMELWKFDFSVENQDQYRAKFREVYTQRYEDYFQ